MGTVTALPVGRPPDFWEDLREREHLVQIYGRPAAFQHALRGFAASALREGEGLVVLATAGHLHALEKALRENEVPVEEARSLGRYVDRLAEEILGHVMVDRWPDEKRCLEQFASLISRARGDGDRRVRVFSELPAVLWARGDHAATIQLELLSARACERERAVLFCAYPRNVFTRNATESIVEICRLHGRVVV